MNTCYVSAIDKESGKPVYAKYIRGTVDKGAFLEWGSESKYNLQKYFNKSMVEPMELWLAVQMVRLLFRNKQKADRLWISDPKIELVF